MNIAEILKNAPKGTKLYSPICGGVTLSEIDEDIANPIIVEDCNGYEITFTIDGKLYSNYEDSECMLFPTKENRNWSAFKVEPQFPTTYIECCRLLDINEDHQYNYGYYSGLLDSFQKLLIFRNAWWKADDNWKPNWDDDSYKCVIRITGNDIIKDDAYFNQHILVFSTRKIRDEFFETFHDLIEECKELIC